MRSFPTSCAPAQILFVGPLSVVATEAPAPGFAETLSTNDRSDRQADQAAAIAGGGVRTRAINASWFFAALLASDGE